MKSTAPRIYCNCRVYPCRDPKPCVFARSQSVQEENHQPNWARSFRDWGAGVAMPPVLTRSSSGQASDGEPPEPQEYSLRLRGGVGDAVAPVAALVRLPQSAVAGVGMGGMGGTIQFGEGGGVMVGRLQFGDGDSIQVSTAARVGEARPRFALVSSRSLHTLRVFGLAHLLVPPLCSDVPARHGIRLLNTP